MRYSLPQNLSVHDTPSPFICEGLKNSLDGGVYQQHSEMEQNPQSYLPHFFYPTTIFRAFPKTETRLQEQHFRTDYVTLYVSIDMVLCALSLNHRLWCCKSYVTDLRGWHCDPDTYSYHILFVGGQALPGRTDRIVAGFASDANVS